MSDVMPTPTNKTSISVPEMRQLLGLGKTDSYWLVKKNHFKTIIAAGQMRIMLDSFEEWYAGQFHYRKITGEAPGSKWTAITMSVSETAALLNIKEATLYDLLKKKSFETMKIDNRTRIDKASFEVWYERQRHYKKVIDRIGGDLNGINC
ncbi:MAG: helix-turn-helix domain-containing protein [Lachnospiraceae bacterium]|nr:helix-turn-helix domain-containing protein [Lachnospiraceae bacterium]